MIGVHLTSHKNAAAIKTTGLLAQSWVQPFGTTDADYAAMSVYLLGGYLRSGARIQEHFLMFDINDIREGQQDTNGGVQLLDPVPPNRLITEIDDPGDPIKTAAAVAIVRAHFGNP